MCVTMSLTLFACKPSVEGPGSTGGNTNVQNSSDAYTEFIDTYVDTINKEDISEPKTTLFMQNGVSEYKLLISESEYSGKVELKAAQEIQFFIQDAYGFKLDIVKDTDESVGDYDTSKKYISIGYTSFYKASPMNDTLDFDVLGNDGYKIQTYGNLVIVNAVGNNGIVYGAYGFLERVMDWNFYAEDVWTMTEADTIYMKDMSVVDIPTFQQRRINTGASDDPQYSIRMRQHGYSAYAQISGLGEAEGWVGSDMSIAYQFMKVTEHWTNHKSWYWADGQKYTGQPCLEALLHNYSGNESQKEVCEEELVNEIKNLPFSYPR